MTIRWKRIGYKVSVLSFYFGSQYKQPWIIRGTTSPGIDLISEVELMRDSSTIGHHDLTETEVLEVIQTELLCHLGV